MYVASASTGEERGEEDATFLTSSLLREKNLQKTDFKGERRRRRIEAELEGGYRLRPSTPRATRGDRYELETSPVGQRRNEQADPVADERRSARRVRWKTDVCAAGLRRWVRVTKCFKLRTNVKTGGHCPEEGVEPVPTMVSQLAGSGVATERSVDSQDTTGVALIRRMEMLDVDNVTSVAAFGGEGRSSSVLGRGS